MNRFDACPKMFFGEDALDYLLKLPREKAVIVTDPYMVSSGTVKVVTDRLDRCGVTYSIFSQVEPDPSIETVAAGMQVIFREKPNLIIALGGGSAIDATKGMLYFCIAFKGGLMEKQYIHRPRFIAIPTTSGTGSEVTSYAVISDREKGVKIPLSHKTMIPDVAILDPSFTKTLPAGMIAFTGMDVLTHAIEAYVSPSRNDFTNMFAREATRLTLRYLKPLYDDVSDTTAREKMYSASTMAGLAFTNSGLGLCHGIAHTLGAQYHIPHGKANAIVLPYVMMFNAGFGKYKASSARKFYARMAKTLAMEAGDEAYLCRQLLLAIKDLSAQFDIPVSLADCGISPEDFNAHKQELVSKMLEDVCTKANPAYVSESDLNSLLDDIYKGNLEVSL